MASKFIPEIWSAETQRIMSEREKLGKPVYLTVTDYTSFTKNAKANGYNGPVLGGVEVKPLPISDEDFAELTKGSFNLLFNERVGVPVLLNNIDEAQSIVPMRKAHSEMAVEALQDYYSLKVIEEIIDATDADQRLPISDQDDGKLTKADFVAAFIALTAAKAPLRGRYCAIGPTYYGDVLSIPEFISRDKIPNTQAMADAAVGMCLGFEVILCGDMPKVDANGDVAETGADVAAFYHKTCCGFGRNKEFGAKEEPKAGVPGDMVNIYSVFGTKIHPDKLGLRAVTVLGLQPGGE